MSQLILQPFCCFTYVTVHSPTLLLLLLRHRIFTYVTWRAAHGSVWTLSILSLHILLSRVLALMTSDCVAERRRSWRGKCLRSHRNNVGRAGSRSYLHLTYSNCDNTQPMSFSPQTTFLTPVGMPMGWVIIAFHCNIANVFILWSSCKVTYRTYIQHVLSSNPSIVSIYLNYESQNSCVKSQSNTFNLMIKTQIILTFKECA